MKHPIFKISKFVQKIMICYVDMVSVFLFYFVVLLCCLLFIFVLAMLVFVVVVPPKRLLTVMLDLVLFFSKWRSILCLWLFCSSLLLPRNFLSIILLAVVVHSCCWIFCSCIWLAVVVMLLVTLTWPSSIPLHTLSFPPIDSLSMNWFLWINVEENQQLTVCPHLDS